MTAAASENISLISHCDQGGRGDGVQVMVHRGYAYVGHGFSNGISVVDVRDLKRPTVANFLPCPPNTRAIHLQTHEDLLRAGMSYVPQGRNIFPLMSVDQNLRLGAYTRPRSPALEADIRRVYDLFPMLREARSKRAADLSGGQQQMLEMGRALLLSPKLMLLDEPTLGLAPIVFKEIFRIIEHLRGMGQTILMVEQNAAQALEISDYAYVLELGENRFDGTGAGIATDERIRRLYLGR